MGLFTISSWPAVLRSIATYISITWLVSNALFTIQVAPHCFTNNHISNCIASLCCVVVTVCVLLYYRAKLTTLTMQSNEALKKLDKKKEKVSSVIDA